MARERRASKGNRQTRDVLLFTMLVLLVIVVVFFVIGYMVGTRLV